MGIGLSIAGGFGNRLSEYMRDKEKFDWENKRAERKFGMTTGQLGVAKANEKAGVSVSKIKYLQERGLDNNILRFAWDQEKVAGIDKLYNEVLEGSDSATGAQLSQLVNVSKDYAAADDRPWTEVVREAMQIYATPENAAKHTQKQKEQKGFWASMLADPSTTSGYDDTQRYGGYTRADQDRIIMASATTPRGEGILKLDRSKRIQELNPTDLYRIDTSTTKLIEDQLDLVKDRILTDSRNIGDGTKSSTQLGNELKQLQTKDNWIAITQIYGDNILQPLYNAEERFPGSILDNPSVSKGKRDWLENKLAKEAAEENQDGSATVPLSEDKTGAIDYEAEFDKAKSSFPKGTDLNAPRFNSVADLKKAIANNTFSDLDSYFIYTPDEGWEAQAKIDLANFSRPGDGDFLKWAKDIPKDRTEGRERFGVTEYKGLLQANVNNIRLIKRVTKIVTSTTSGKEYTFAEYSKAFGIGQKKEAKRLGLPRTNAGWDDASEANGYKIKYNLTPYTYSGDK